MKKLITAAFLLLGMAASAQKISSSAVPAAVKTTFGKNFPGITDVKWEKEKGNYEANFSMNSQKMSALFEKNGKQLETESSIVVTRLPREALMYLAQNYDGKKVKEAALIRKADGTENYEAAINGEELIFDAGGKLISKGKAD